MLDAIAGRLPRHDHVRRRRARALATLVGVLILAVLDNGLTQMNVDSYLREVLVGAIILAAVASARIGLDRG
jgi:ribose transport system permease protein